MSQDEASGPQPNVDIEERGVVIDVLVPLAQAGVAGAVGAVVNNHLKKSADPPPPPPAADGE